MPTSPKNWIVSLAIETTMPVVVRTDSSAAAASRPLMTCSPTERRVRRRIRSGPGPPPAPLAAMRSVAATCYLRLRLCQVGLGLRELLLRHRHDARGLGDLLLLRDHEVHERLHLGTRHGLGAGVHEQRT